MGEAKLRKVEIKSKIEKYMRFVRLLRFISKGISNEKIITYARHRNLTR